MRLRSATLWVFVLLLAIPAAGRSRPRPGVSPALDRALATAQPGERVAAWVFLADKSDAASNLREAERRLTPHARARRARNRGPNHLVDAYDIPVDTRYVAALRAHGGHVRQVSRWLNAISVDVDAAAAGRIAALPFVRGMDVVRAGHAPLPVPVVQTAPEAPLSERSTFSLNYGPSFNQNNLIDVPPLHDQGYTGSGVWICMLDAGFNNPGHVAFQNLDVLVTRDFVNGDSIVVDQTGQAGSGNHGTETLSTIGGYAPGNLIGPAFGATYILAKTENTDWERHVEEDAWVAGAEWADSIGADIISSSLGYSTGFTNGEPSYSWMDLDGNTTIVTVGADIAASRGILVVNSAGNDGSVALPANTLIGPADGDSVLAVGAVDSGGARASFSSVGPTADGRIKPDVMAMGVAVHVASPSNPNNFLDSSGTSFSCPLVAGASALLLQARPNATNQQIMDALRATATQSNSPDRLNGWGIIDAAAALNMIPTAVAATAPRARATLYPPHPNPFNPSTTIEYDIVAPGHVTLAVFDVRGARVATLVDADQSAGTRSLVWNARDQRGTPLASGVYFCRLTAAGTSETRRLVLLK